MVRFRLLTEADVRSVLTMDDLIETMASALKRFSAGRVVQPVRTVISVYRDDAFFGSMPAFVRASESEPRANFGAVNSLGDEQAALGEKLVTVFGANAARGLHTHLATIVLLDPATGALVALLDGRYITESRTAAVSAVSSRLLARKTASSLAIIGSGVQAYSHLEALSRVHRLRSVSVWSPNADRRRRFVDDYQRLRSSANPAAGADHLASFDLKAVDHAGEAVVGADLIVLVTS